MAQYASISASVSESDVSIGDNSSKVTVILYCTNNGYANDSPAWSITIAGQEVNHGTYNLTEYFTNREIGRGSLVVTHDSDGTKTVSWGASYQGTAKETPSQWLSLSGNKTLTPIARASEIVSIGSFNIEEPFALEIDKKAESFTDKLTIKLGDDVIKVINDYESEVNIEFTDDEQLTLYNLIDDWSDTLTFLLETYNGGTLIGSDTATETVTIKGDVTYHTNNADKGATFYVGTANGVRRCITYDGTKRTYR